MTDVSKLFTKSPAGPPKKHACTIVNMLPYTFMEEKPHMLPSAFTIPAADKDGYGIFHIEEGVHYIPNPLVDEGKPGSSIKQITLAEEMARSVVEDYSTAHVALAENAGPGLFWVSGRLTLKNVMDNYPEEVEYYATRQKNWFRNLCALADADWNKNHNMLAVSDLQRLAAKALGINKEWVDFQVQESVNCPMCQAAVNPAAIVCSSCKYIVRPELYKKEQFANA